MGKVILGDIAMRRSIQRTLLVAAAFLLTAGPMSYGKVIYVDDNARPLGDGTSWATAYRFLQDALTDAAMAEKPVEIRVAQGTYTPDRGAVASEGMGDRLAAFALIDGIAVTGGYAGLGASDPNAWDVDAYASVLSGDLAGDDVLAEDPCDFVEHPEDGIWSPPEDWCLLIESTRRENSIHIVTAVETTGAAVLEGFTLTGGHAYYPPHWWTWDAPTICKDEDYGGALFHQGMAVTLRACTFVANSALGLGGAVYSLDSSALVLEDCRFMENYSYQAGGAIHVEGAADVVMTGCVLEKNDARDYGSAMCVRDCNSLFTNCTFAENCSLTANAALYCLQGAGVLESCTFSSNEGGGIDSSADLTIMRCVFTGNTGVYGGALHLDRSDTCLFTCSFSGNNAGREGGGVYASESHTKMSNCLISGNSAMKGGGLFNRARSTAALLNCTFSRNVALVRGGAVLGQNDSSTCLSNSILWDNQARQGSEIALEQYPDGSHPSSASVSYTLMKEDPSSVSLDSNCRVSWGSGNIEGDPCFADPGYWDPNGTADDPNDDFFVEGDYHLKSQAGRWDKTSGSWVQDEVTSPCIDAGDPNSPIGYEPFPNGGIINMGAYGGTAQASKSYFGEPPCETMIAGDINGDCRVDVADIIILLDHWLQTGEKAGE